MCLLSHAPLSILQYVRCCLGHPAILPYGSLPLPRPQGALPSGHQVLSPSLARRELFPQVVRVMKEVADFVNASPKVMTDEGVGR